MRTLGLLCSVGLVSIFAPANAGAEDFAQRVNKAIDDGVAWLRSKQQKDGSWGPCVATGRYDGSPAGDSVCNDSGPTSFSLFALAECGVTKKDKTVRAGLKWLREQKRSLDLWTSYESSSYILALTSLNRPKRWPKTRGRRLPAGARFSKADWKILRVHVAHLLACQGEHGGFGYWARERDYADVSATQFAVLALRAAGRCGLAIEGEVWRRVTDYLLRVQHGDARFSYRPKDGWTAGMTAAGLGSLIVCVEQLARDEKQDLARANTAIARAIATLNKVGFNVNENVGADGADDNYHYCYLYAVERFGSLAGKREIGGKDWYSRGAAYLLAKQAKDGHWYDRRCMAPRDVLGTCFALLFLKRATPPVITPRSGWG